MNDFCTFLNLSKACWCFSITRYWPCGCKMCPAPVRMSSPVLSSISATGPSVSSHHCQLLYPQQLTHLFPKPKGLKQSKTLQQTTGTSCVLLNLMWNLWIHNREAIHPSERSLVCLANGNVGRMWMVSSQHSETP